MRIGVALLVLVSSAVAAADDSVPSMQRVADRPASDSFALQITLPLAPASLGEKLAPTEDSYVLGYASAIDASALATKKKVKRASREWRPDLVFRNGGVRFIVAMKF